MLFYMSSLYLLKIVSVAVLKRFMAAWFRITFELLSKNDATESVPAQAKQRAPLVSAAIALPKAILAYFVKEVTLLTVERIAALAKISAPEVGRVTPGFKTYVEFYSPMLRYVKSLAK